MSAPIPERPAKRPAGRAATTVILLLVLGIAAVQRCSAAERRSQALDQTVSRAANQLRSMMGPASWKECALEIGVMAKNRPAGGFEAVQAAASDIATRSGFELTVVDGPPTSHFWVLWGTPESGTEAPGMSFASTVPSTTAATTADTRPITYIRRSDGAVATDAGLQIDPSLTPDALARHTRWGIAEVLSGWDTMSRIQWGRDHPTVSPADDPPFDIAALAAAARSAGCRPAGAQ